MLLFHSHAITGAHRLLSGLAAFADADTTQHGAGKTALVLRPAKMRVDLRRPVVSADTEIFGDIIRIDYLAGIHFPFRVPDRFELAKSFDQFRAEHFWQEPAARLPVAMFT